MVLHTRYPRSTHASSDATFRRFSLCLRRSCRCTPHLSRACVTHARHAVILVPRPCTSSPSYRNTVERTEGTASRSSRVPSHTDWGTCRVHCLRIDPRKKVDMPGSMPELGHVLLLVRRQVGHEKEQDVHQPTFCPSSCRPAPA